MAWSLNKSSGVDGLVYSGRPLIVVRAISAATRTAIVADTPHREPAGLAVLAGIQATTIVVQAVLADATVRGSRPPDAVGASTDERAIVVVPTKDRRESGGVASNATHLIKGWEPPALGADVLGGVSLRSRADRPG